MHTHITLNEGSKNGPASPLPRSQVLSSPPRSPQARLPGIDPRDSLKYQGKISEPHYWGTDILMHFKGSW